MEELFFYVNKPSQDAPIEVYGCVTRTVAHALGISHTSVLLVPVTWVDEQKEPVIFVHKRSSFKSTCPDTWDFCGGHLSFEDWHCRYLQSSLSGAHLIEQVAEHTAVREANEELKCDPVFEFRTKHIHRFRSVGYFECDNKHKRGHNVEFSTAFVVSVPEDRTVAVWDTDREGERQLEVKRFTLNALLSDFKNKKESFADGAGRILEKLLENSNLKAEFADLIESSTDTPNAA